MKYPMLSQYACIHRHRFNNSFIVNELTDEVIPVDKDPQYFDFIQHLDGKTDPYSIRCDYSCKEVKDILDELADLNLLRTSRWLHKSWNNLAYALYMPKKGKSGSFALKIIHLMLFLSVLPILAIGIWLFLVNLHTIHIQQVSMPGILTGYLFGILIHETGHALATLVYGGKVYECGVQLTNLLLPGAYVSLTLPASSTTLQRIQVSAAGVEMNFLTAGIGLMLTAGNLICPDFFFSFTIANIILGLINLMLCNGLDGCAIFSYMFGLDEESIVSLARNVLFHSQRRRMISWTGPKGKAAICTFGCVLLIQLALPVLLGLSLWEVISWFV